MSFSLARFIPKLLRCRTPTLIAAWIDPEPIGEWGVLDTATGRSEICGLMHGANVIVDDGRGRLWKARQWVAGPMRRRIARDNKPELQSGQRLLLK